MPEKFANFCNSILIEMTEYSGSKDSFDSTALFRCVLLILASTLFLVFLPVFPMQLGLWLHFRNLGVAKQTIESGQFRVLEFAP